MKKYVQILLLCLFFPSVLLAKEESLEERKQRIVRKYMTERATVSQSDMEVSYLNEKDEKLAASEEYGKTKDLYARQDGITGGMPAAVPMRPRVSRRRTETESDNSWLLADESLQVDDGNPFKDPFESDQAGASRKKSDFWASQRSSTSTESESRYGRERYNPYSSRERAAGMNSGRQDGYSSSLQKSSRYGQSSYGSPDGSLYGQSSRSTSSSYESSVGSGLGTQGIRTYGSNPQTGLLNSISGIGTQSRSRQGYESGASGSMSSPTYKSQFDRTYKGQQNNINSPYGNSSQEQQYKRPDTYKPQRSRDSWDPTKSDSYLDQIRNQR